MVTFRQALERSTPPLDLRGSRTRVLKFFVFDSLEVRKQHPPKFVLTDVERSGSTPSHNIHHTSHSIASTLSLSQRATIDEREREEREHLLAHRLAHAQQPAPTSHTAHSIINKQQTKWRSPWAKSR